MADRWGNSGNSVRLYFFGLQNHCRRWLQPWNKKTLTPWEESYDQSRQHIQKQRHYFSNKGPFSQSYGFSCGHVWMWELDYKESWALRNWCLWTVVLEKTLESPLDSKEIQPVNPKGNQSWMFIGRTDAEAETSILWPPDANWLVGKDPDAGKDWSGEEKGTTEDEMVGRYHRLDGCEFEWTPGAGDGQGGLACCNSWGRKESDTTERLNWTEWHMILNIFSYAYLPFVHLLGWDFYSDPFLLDCSFSYYWGLFRVFLGGLDHVPILLNIKLIIYMDSSPETVLSVIHLAFYLF